MGVARNRTVHDENISAAFHLAGQTDWCTYTVLFFLWSNSPKSRLGRLSVQVSAWYAITHTHTHRQDSSGRVISSSQRPPPTQHNKYRTQPIHALSGAQTRAVTAINQQQSHALDRRATWFGCSVLQSYVHYC
jgi:hypothetical protein